MHPRFLQSKLLATDIENTIQGAVGEVLALLNIWSEQDSSADFTTFLDESYGPAIDTFLDADVNSELLSTPNKDQAFDYFITRRRELNGQMVYSYIKVGEVKTYKNFKADNARLAVSSVIRALTHALFLDVAPGSTAVVKGMELVGVKGAVTAYEEDMDASMLNKLLAGKGGLRQGYIKSDGGIFIAGCEKVDGKTAGRTLIFPQIDKIRVNGGKTPVILIERSGMMQGTTTQYKVKAGLIANSNIVVNRDPTTREIIPGEIFFKQKGNAALIQPMVMDAKTGLLVPNPAFWLSTDVNAEWDTVVHDSFATDPTIPLTVKEIGWGVDYATIQQAKREVMSVLSAGTQASGWSRIRNLFSLYMQKIKHWLVGGESGGIIETNQEAQTQLKRRLGVQQQIELLLNQQLGLMTAEGEPIPYRLINRIFPGGNQLASQGRYDAETIEIDLKQLGKTNAFLKASGLVEGSGSKTGIARIEILSRNGMRDQAKIDARKKIVIDWLTTNQEAAQTYADLLTSRRMYDFLTSRCNFRTLCGKTPAQWGALSNTEKASLIAEKGVITDEIQTQWIREISAVQNLINTIPGARAMDVAKVGKKIQEFIDLINSKRASKTSFYTLETDSDGKGYIRLVKAELDQLLNAWRAIWREALGSISTDAGWQDFIKVYFNPIVRNANGQIAAFSTHYRIKMYTRVLAWMAGLIDPGIGARDLIEGVMFPELKRCNSRDFFEMLVNHNQGEWREIRHTDTPVGGKHYFEVALFDTQGNAVEASRRVGYYEADAVYPNDPFNAGVTFFVRNDLSPSLTAGELFLVDEDGNDYIFAYPADTLIMPGVTNFMTALPGD